MSRTRTAVALPLWAVVVGMGLLLMLLLRVQPAPSPTHFLGQPVHVMAPGGESAQGSSANQPADAGINQSVATKTGTTQVASAQSQAVTPQANLNQGAANANNPCARTTKPSPACPVAAP